MISKEILISWLYEHGKLTADLEFDIHDCFDAALDSALAVIGAVPSIGHFSARKRLDSFYTTCRQLEERMSRGLLEPCEALVALNILRVLSPTFRKAIREFDNTAPALSSSHVSRLPQLAREYLDSSTDLNAPLVAG